MVFRNHYQNQKLQPDVLKLAPISDQNQLIRY